MSIPVQIKQHTDTHLYPLTRTDIYPHTNSYNISKEPQNIQQNTETLEGANCHCPGFMTEISNTDTLCFGHKNSPPVTM